MWVGGFPVQNSLPPGMYVGGWFFFPKLFAYMDVCGWVVFLSKTLCLHTSMEAESSGKKNHPPTYIHGGKEFWVEKPPTHMHPWSGELYAHTGTLQQQADLKSYKLTSLAPLLCSLFLTADAVFDNALEEII